jgi:hypothetical protein
MKNLTFEQPMKTHGQHYRRTDMPTLFPLTDFHDEQTKPPQQQDDP